VIEYELREYVAFDLETTGLVAETDRVVEIGAVRFDATGREIGRFEQLVNPERPMSPAAQAIHGISDAHLVDAPIAAEVFPRFLAFLAEDTTTLLAHNAAFDAGFLGRELGRLGFEPPSHAVVDTLALARRSIPFARDHRLDTLARLLDLDPDGAHRALADSLRVKGLFLRLNRPDVPVEALIAYPIYDPLDPMPPPRGWEDLNDAIVMGYSVRLEYSGGTRGAAPREVSPRRFVQRGGVAYVVALCHLDRFEKSFRLDRVVRYEIVHGQTAAVSLAAPAF
jgi:DNA polymerase III epsilon subunit family exonuclease